ncbi:MAG: ABC transporter permease [Ruminococcaceae bacterium]|jgi:simple sugar transport system permease protein|nr:ABC transporter permease [Oscillospiraceae bacterium]
MKKNLLKSNAVQSMLASLLCIVLGLLLGYIVLLFINPSGAGEAIMAVVKNFWNYSRANLQVKNFGNTLVKTAPLLMCALSVLFAYKVGLFNIGTAGQYVVGSCACLYAALRLHWGWFGCLLLAILIGAVYGALVGLLKAYCNVNEVISGIMLNWIGLYTTNMLLASVKESTSPYTLHLKTDAPQAMLPTMGLGALFNNNGNVTIAIPLSIILAIVIMILLDKTKLGYELRATGNNKNAAKYAGMAEKRNIILTLAISGCLAALGGAFLYLTDFEQWSVTQSSVPGMGFNGIAAAFLGGLNPIGTIFASYFIQHITVGGAYVDKTMYSSQISDLISSLIIYLCGFVLFIKYAMNMAIAKSEEKQLRQEKQQAAPAGQGEKGGDK